MIVRETYKIVIAILVLILLSCDKEENPSIVVLEDSNVEGFNSKYYDWGMEAMDQIYADFCIPGSNLFYENQDKKQSTYLWGNIFILFVQAEASHIKKEKHESDLNNIYSACETHWHPNYLNIAGYASGTRGKESYLHRFYDENGWMAIGLCEAYLVTREEKFLLRAKAAISFALSGEDEVLDGGIYFKETFTWYEEQKNTICCAVTMLGCLKLYEITREEQYLNDAIRINNWVSGRLLDPADNLLWDAQYTDDSRINYTKWSCNAGFMVRAWLMLYRFTDNMTYLIQAKMTLSSSEKKWYNPETGAFSDPGYFAFTIIDSWFDLYSIEKNNNYIKKALRSIEFIHEECKDENGRYPEYWNKAVNYNQIKWSLYHQAVVPYIYLRASRLSVIQ